MAKVSEKSKTKTGGDKMKKATTKKATPKKTMKREIVRKEMTLDVKEARKMCNGLLTKVKGLTLVENGWGAVQIKRNGALMVSFLTRGIVLVTHPMTNKKGDRIFKHYGSKDDHLSLVPQADVTLAMLIARCKDAKNSIEYHDEMYKGKKIGQSAIQMARAKINGVKTTTKDAKKKVTSSKRKAEKAKKTVIKREAAVKKPKTKLRKAAIERVAAKA